MLTFLRNGNQYYLVCTAFGFMGSARFSGDLLQYRGVVAWWQSWQRGFATEEFVKHKAHELTETVISTTVQIFALGTLSSKGPESAFILQFAGFASLSLAVSIPESLEARLLIHGIWCDVPDFQNFYATARARSSIPRMRKFVGSAATITTGAVAQALTRRYSWIFGKHLLLRMFAAAFTGYSLVSVFLTTPRMLNLSIVLYGLINVCVLGTYAMVIVPLVRWHLGSESDWWSKTWSEACACNVSGFLHGHLSCWWRVTELLATVAQALIFFIIPVLLACLSIGGVFGNWWRCGQEMERSHESSTSGSEGEALGLLSNPKALSM